MTNEWLSKLAIDGLCKAIAVFLHYSLLSTFAWMAIEGLHLYLMLIKVFNIYVRHYIYKLAIAGWGEYQSSILLFDDTLCFTHQLFIDPVEYFIK